MGKSVLDPEQALDVWAQLETDERLFEIESTPPETETFLRLNVYDRNPSPQIWTDAWLAALAEASGFQMVSFDRDFKCFNLSSLDILKP